MSKVSVIIPVYNCCTFIAEAIESVLSQTYQNFEVIIIDDGSTDTTKNEVMKYVLEYPKKIKYYWQKNGGISKARNMGINLSEGEYIALIDSDDIWLPQKLEIQIAALNEKKLDLVYTNALFIDKNRESLKRLYATEDEMKLPSRDIFLQLVLRNFIPISSVVAKRHVFSNIGLFNNDFQSSEDTEWLLRVAHEYKLCGINNVLIQYRIHSANSSKNLELLHKYSIRIIERNVDLYPEISDKLGKKLTYCLSEKYLDLGYEFFAQYNFKEAREKLLRSIRYTPFFRMRKYAYLFFTFFPSNLIKMLRGLKGSSLINMGMRRKVI